MLEGTYASKRQNRIKNEIWEMATPCQGDELWVDAGVVGPSDAVDGKAGL